jgi:hypothetical protein
MLHITASCAHPGILDQSLLAGQRMLPRIDISVAALTRSGGFIADPSPANSREWLGLASVLAANHCSCGVLVGAVRVLLQIEVAPL